MKNKNSIKSGIILISALLLILTACVQNAVPVQTGTIVSMNSNESGLASYPDFPLDSVPTAPISVKFLVEHRTALNGKTVAVQGVVTLAALGKNACSPEVCRPRIFLADTMTETRDKNYDTMVLVSEKDIGYSLGQSVLIKGIVDSSKINVVVEKKAIGNMLLCSAENDCATKQVGERQIPTGANSVPLYVCINKGYVNDSSITMQWANDNNIAVSNMLEQKCGCTNNECGVIPIGIQPPPAPEKPKTEVKEKEFCCGYFNEGTGKTEYSWSDDSHCGIPKGVACAGSCASVRDKNLCR